MTARCRGRRRQVTVDAGTRRRGNGRRRSRAARQWQICRQSRWRWPALQRFRHARRRRREFTFPQRFCQRSGLAWTGDRFNVGGAYGYDDTKYGIPVVEGGILQFTPRRHALTFRAGAERLDGTFESFRASVAHRRYKHDELEGEEVGTAFSNDTTECRSWHRTVTSGGLPAASVDGRSIARSTRLAQRRLSPAVDQNGFAAFAYEEVTWPHVTLQFGGRLDHTRYVPVGEPERDFTNGSFSAGLLFRPAAADDRLTIAARSGGRCARSGARGAVLFRPAPGKLRVRGGQPRARARACARCRRGAALACTARVWRSDLFSQRHRRLHLPPQHGP